MNFYKTNNKFITMMIEGCVDIMIITVSLSS